MDGKNGCNSMRLEFPLTAMTGFDDVTYAISCGLCGRGIRAILISGPAGTGKSTAARGCGGLSPEKKIINLPLNSTMEQIFGGLDLEKALTEGRKISGDSVLRRSNGNIIVVDNINLLPKDTLLVLMDSITECNIRAETEISVDESCNTLLIATMDPNEGELDGHILDRFDICVFTSSEQEEDLRREVLKSRLSFDKDPDSFIEMHLKDELDAEFRIKRARNIEVKIPNDYPTFISNICAEMHIEGHRGDISVLRTACALAALDNRELAGMEDLKKAAELCLSHRRRDIPPEEDRPEPEDDGESEEPPEQDDRSPSDARNNPSDDSEKTLESDPMEGDRESDDNSDKEKIFAIGDTFEVTDYVPPEHRNNHNRISGRQDLSISKDGSGRCIGYKIPRGKVNDVALLASIMSAAPYQIFRKHNGLAVAITKDDLREKIRIRGKGTKILFVVDGSGSVGAHNRMVAVKGAILSMLNDAYKRRDEVGLVVFRGENAEEILPLTRSVFMAYRSLEDIPTGGRTPLISGLEIGYSILQKDDRNGMEPVMVILTDGRGNVSCSGNSAVEELERVSEVLLNSNIRRIVVDTETGIVRFGKAWELSRMIGAEYIGLEDLNAENLSDSIRNAMTLFR